MSGFGAGVEYVGEDEAGLIERLATVPEQTIISAQGMAARLPDMVLVTMLNGMDRTVAIQRAAAEGNAEARFLIAQADPPLPSLAEGEAMTIVFWQEAERRGLDV
jgi:hypothetical protein